MKTVAEPLFRSLKGYAGSAAAIGLIKAYMDAPGGADVEARIGEEEGNPGKRFLIVSCGGKIFGLTKEETGIICDIAEDAIRKFGDEQDLSTLIVSLRYGASQL